MKKLTVIVGIVMMLVALFAYPVSAIETFILVYDAPGNFKGVQDAPSGLSIAGETLYSLGEVVTLGYGLEIPTHSLNPPSVFGFIPVFGVIKVAPFGKFPMDFSVRAGYSILTGDHAYTDPYPVMGGLYYGCGLGYFINQDETEKSFTKLELLYSVCNGARIVGGDPRELSCSRYSFLISFGYEGI